MAVIKCKMCGGDLELIEGSSVCECEYCGTKQTVPNADNDKKLTLFARANRLRSANEFDKAAGVYESIVAEFPEEAEAYWGLVLCRYGIEYVDDPATGKKIPTCHRSSFDSVLKDTDFDQACENADAIARRQYREEAKQLEDIRRGIIDVSGKEEPYDIFICYKETDDNGERTIDSVLAQDVYDALTEKGYRVFFSRVSLEDKLGMEYEPYIFAALNSAKVMLAFGTDYEYYNAVWVKNEWSRFLKLMAKDKSKHLIPCYKNLDPYDIPDEFQRLQAQDLGKVGAVQDLLRGIEKILGGGKSDTPPAPKQAAPQGGGPNMTALLQRGALALEDGDWDRAKEFFDQVLNMDAQYAEAYLGLALADKMCHSTEELGTITDRDTLNAFEQNPSYQKFLRFATPEQKSPVEGAMEQARAAVTELEEQSRREVAERTERIRHAQGLLATARHTVGVRSDGTVAATRFIEGEYIKYYGQCDVSDWKDIVAVAASSVHTVGLRSDGTVAATRFIESEYLKYSGQCDVSDWKDIVAVAAGSDYTVGLRSDGTVAATRFIESKHLKYSGQCDVSGWKDIVAVAAGGNQTVGLRSDGTVVAVGINADGQCDVSEWRDIVAVATGPFHTVGLRSDGTVVATRFIESKHIKYSGQCDVSGWTDIVAVAAGVMHTVGLRSDGTVVATRFIESEHFKYSGQCNVSDWKDIVAVAAGQEQTVGLRSDGTVVAVGKNDSGECNVHGWKLFGSLDTLEQERKEAAERAEQERKEAAERAEQERKEAAERAEQERKKAAERVKREAREAAERVERERKERLAALTAEQAALQAELPTLKGFFSGKRRKEIETRLAELEEELKRL